MRGLVTDRNNDYISASDFPALANHLNQLTNGICRTGPPPTSTTTPTPTPTPTLPFCAPDVTGPTQPPPGGYTQRITDHIYTDFTLFCSYDNLSTYILVLHYIVISRLRWCPFTVTLFQVAVTACRLYFKSIRLYFALCCLVCVRDISFVIDSSGSIAINDPDNWQHVIDFIVRVVSELNVSISGTHVGAVSFGM